jgi:exopolysaccharide/PEP-CTERM locus tyrosine autokinase
MSRIETALEKASQLREPEQEAPQVSSPTDEARSQQFIPKNPFIVTLTAPDSPAAEEYRKLKATVVRLTRQEGARNAIMVTSSFSGEGKSLTSINLAVSLAQEVSHSALLIDADLRRPSLAEYLGIQTEAGLSDCLRDGAAVSSAIIRTGVAKLDLLPAGSRVRNPVELLASPKMKTLINELKRQHPERYLIIDTPPILPFAETQIISQLADSVLFVVKAGKATMQDMQDALDVLKGARVLGIAFNEMSVQGANNRYRHYYKDYASRQQRET